MRKAGIALSILGVLVIAGNATGVFPTFPGLGFLLMFAGAAMRTRG